MPLFDVTYDHDGVLITPKQCKNNPIIVKAKTLAHSKTFDKMVNTIDSALSKLKPSACSKLIWTKCGALLGHQSPESVKDINHLWEKTYEIYYNGQNKLSLSQQQDLDETCLRFVGSLLRWRVAYLTDNTWLLYRQDIDRKNRHGKDIYVSEYWINNDFNAKPEVDFAALKRRFR